MSLSSRSFLKSIKTAKSLCRAGVAAIVSAATLLLSGIAIAQDKTFADWTVHCSTSNYCTAETGDRNSDDIGNPDNILRIGRHGDNRASWEISVITQKTTPALLGPAQFRIAGQRPFKLSPNRDYTLFDVPNEFFLTASSSNQPLLRRMAESRRAFVTLGERNANQVKASFSLIGLAEALLWIDRKQDREGSRRVVAAPTKRDEPSTKIAQDSLSSDTISVALKVHQQAFADGACSSLSPDVAKENALIAPLDENTVLVAFACNITEDTESSAVYRVNISEKAADLQLWAVYSETLGWQATKTLANVRFNPDTKELTAQHSVSGNKNCTSQGRWLWSGGKFAMQDFRTTERCDENTASSRQIYP